MRGAAFDPGPGEAVNARLVDQNVRDAFAGQMPAFDEHRAAPISRSMIPARARSLALSTRCLTGALPPARWA